MWKKILLWLFCGALGLFVVGMLINSIMLSRQGSWLAKEAAAIRATGAPATIADLASAEPLDPEQNAAVLLKRAEPGILAITQSLAPIQGNLDYQAGRYTKSIQNGLLQALEQSPDAVALVHRAANSQGYQSQLEFKNMDGSALIEELIELVGLTRNALRVLDAEAVLQAAQQKPDESLQTSIEMLQLSRMLENEPALISYLVSVAGRSQGIANANRALRTGPVSEQTHRQLAKEIAAHDMARSFVKALQSERVVNLESAPAKQWLVRAILNDQLVSVSELHKTFQEAIEKNGLSNKPVSARLTALSKPLLAAMEASRDASLRTQASLRCLQVVNAATAQGDKDWRLENLGLPKETQLDPYSRRPLIVVETERGWKVYSVGNDGVDDGGSIDNVKDIGLGP